MPNEVVTQTEAERIRLKMARLIDSACDAFEDIVDNSDDDKARVAAAKELAGLWSKLNGLDTPISASPTAPQININVGALRDTLQNASLAMRRCNDVDAAISIAELTAEAYEISPVPETPREPFEEVIDLTQGFNR